MSRRNFLALTALGESAAVLAACGVDPTPNQVPPGVTCAYFPFGYGRLDMAVNSVAPGLADPINNRYRYKLGKGTLRKTGESEFKHTMSFVPRNLT